MPQSKKTRALLVFLVLTGRPQRRDRLCELFWELPDDPRGALRWSLSRLRKAMAGFGEDWIHADRERVEWRGTGLWVDLFEMRAAAGEPGRVQGAEWERLVDAAQQPPLQGLDLAHQDLFQAWLVAERDEIDAARARFLTLAAARETEPVRALRLYRAAMEAAPAASAAAAEGAVAMLRRLGRAEEAAALATEWGVREEALALAGDGWAERPHPLAPARGSFAETLRLPLPQAGEGVTSAGAGHRSMLSAQEIRFMATESGVHIAYACVGGGPPLVKAANWLSHLELDWDSPTWGRLFAALARDHQFIRYDERGTGLSDWEVGDISFDAFVGDLEAVVDALGLERFPLLGISQGCAVGVEYAARHPERVSHLVLYGGYAVGWRPVASAEEAAEREAVITLTRVGWGKDDPVYRRIFSSTFMPWATPDELAWFDEFQRRTASPENAAKFLEAFADIDVRHRLAQVRAPTLVLHSRGDHRIALEKGRALAAGIPGARFVTLDSENHILLGREPAMDVLIGEVRRFLGC